MKLFETLEKQLQKENDFVTDDGELKKWVVLNKAQNFDARLIELLLDDQDLKAKFFIEVKGVLVFKQNLFVQFLEQKNYLNDSYTQYKNKVGLTIDGKYLKQRNEVALVWPFKDCILEGGQSREEDKRQEIFFNEILAQDEITQLLDPKVLTNAKVYDKDGQQDFKKFNRDAEINKKRGLPENTITDNLIIKGNNLLALHSLKKEFAGKVKLIYIDPPYNTGGAEDSFTYNNSFNHSTWLTFMKNRLTVAKELLKDDGFIAIAIDHYELGYLIVLGDEIFGKENRIGIITILHNPEGRQNAKHFTATNEFLLVYKRSELSKFNKVFLQENIKTSIDINKIYDKEDEKGLYKEESFIRLGGGNASLREKKLKAWYEVYVSPDLSDLSLENKEGYTKILPITNRGQERTWKIVKSSFIEQCKKGDIYAKADNEKIILCVKYRIDKGSPITTCWSNSKYNAKTHGTKLLANLLANIFSYPKSLYAVADTIKIMSSKNDLILDFHAGSGTTGHAVMELNKEDKGSRQFILVEQLTEHIEICNERIQKVIEQNKQGSFTYVELKKHNQTFIEQIEQAKDSKALLQIWQEMKAKSFLNYNVDLKKQEEHIEEFQQLELSQQKEHLLELLDKNQLYVNLSSINDKDFAVSEAETQVTKDFYN